MSKEFGLLNGHTYIIGREGTIYIEDHIYINSPSVSRRHAAMKIKNGRIYLRDLDSTNGTYLIENDSLVPFKEGYVSPSQSIVIGEVECTINSLLAIAGVYSASKNNTSDIEETKPSIPINKTLKKQS
ncbi:MAG: FHA domain-containing protein [Gammaproteobacteria bacterium]|nr:FHA domain-containing protein [Gammaproteobacteria bacterium]